MPKLEKPKSSKESNIKAKVVHTGHTSMVVCIEATSENPLTGEKRRCVTSHFSMVALDNKRHPTRVPPLLVTTPKEKKAFALAAERRKFLLGHLEGRRPNKKA